MCIVYLFVLVLHSDTISSTGNCGWGESPKTQEKKYICVSPSEWL